MHAAILILLLGWLLTNGCHRGPILPLSSLETRSADPSEDHLKIASYYKSEAMRSRQMAEELAERAAVYERLFGLESDWVTGARLLAQFYEDSAREQDRQAEWHLELAYKQSNH